MGFDTVHVDFLSSLLEMPKVSAESNFLKYPNIHMHHALGIVSHLTVNTAFELLKRGL